MSNEMTNRNPNLDPLTLPLHGSNLIEASAGTGKTFTIAILYVRLVLGHQQPEASPLARGLLPPNLLVVTFTDAATKELRDRIRTRLTQAAEVFSDAADSTGPSPETALIHQLRDESYPDPATWPECRKKLLLAAEWMDEAAVSTIHAWCNRMLSEHAFDSGSLFKLTLETDQSNLLDDVVRDYWRTFIYPLPGALMDEALDHWKTPGDLRKSVRNLIPDADSLGTPAGDVKEAIEATQKQRLNLARELKQYPWGDWKQEVLELLDSLHKSKRLHGGSKKTMVAAWDTLLEWTASDALYPEGMDKAGFQNQTPEVLPTKLKGEDPAPAHPAFDAIAELVAFSQNLPSAKSDIVKHAAAWIAERLESEKQQRSEMGFDDLLTRLDDALHGPRGDQLAATIRRQFPVALIDEFQDTDPIQYRIFNRVYRVADNDPHTCMLMIGDPKQAIYGFRGADIYTYLKARRGARERTWTLGRNFRSAEPMVKAVNRVFQYADHYSRDGAFLFGRGDTSPLPFQGVDANGTRRLWSVNGEVQPSLTFWPLESEEEDRNGKSKGLAKGAATADLAEACASEIARLLTLGQQGQAGFALTENPADINTVTPGDIAILVNNRNEASAVRNALGQRQIKSVYLSDRDSVLTSPEAAEVLCWLRAFAEPRQLGLARAALATPTLGQSWQSLNRLLTDEIALEREIERFMGYQQQWQAQGVLPMLRSFLMDFDVPGRLLQRPDGERRLTDILHIAELLQQDSLQLDGEHALVHHFTQILRAADEEDEHRTLRLESDAGLVQVITVHKSKGLEYPLVFLPFGTSFRAESEKQAWVRYHDDTDRLVTVFDPMPEDIARADRERLGEDIRKVYVALTRARFATWVGVAAIEQWSLSGLGYLMTSSGDGQQALAESLGRLASGEPAISVTPLPEPSDIRYDEPAPESLGPALVSNREAREDWWIASYSAIEYTGMAGTGIVFSGEVEDAETQNLLEESAQDTEEAPPELTPAHDHHHFPKGAGPGTFLHEVLEWCTQQGFRTVVDNPPLLRDYLVRRCSTRGWSDWVEPLEQWLLGLLDQPLPLQRETAERVSLAQLTTLRPELEFWFESCNVSTRAMDRLVKSHTLNQADRPQAEAGRFNGMLKGFIDLVFEHNGQYYVLDYKSNTLGENDTAYTDQAMGEAILEKRYDLQYVLYLLALHRLLKSRLPDYDYDTHIGGAVYLFLRGYRAPTAGAFTDKPPRKLIEELDAMFNGQSGQGEAAA
ncbi:exodeoxyribonuclease V subunit beta [Marinobacter sediminum]|uniref:exodeoxyribonuclease V subunit beta n=1 Tax=Marinobacter sediminum TaxID=256323 RepID=UPI0020300C6C|nr:exodeoxyribonuclease V subunit beta [Marinobacter sediminum]MCM0613892.1 exodeoxyribonuclease V subunit beta [Marinobacter sediminum]